MPCETGGFWLRPVFWSRWACCCAPRGRPWRSSPRGFQIPPVPRPPNGRSAKIRRARRTLAAVRLSPCRDRRRFERNGRYAASPRMFVPRRGPRAAPEGADSGPPVSRPVHRPPTEHGAPAGRGKPAEPPGRQISSLHKPAHVPREHPQGSTGSPEARRTGPRTAATLKSLWTGARYPVPTSSPRPNRSRSTSPRQTPGWRGHGPAGGYGTSWPAGRVGGPGGQKRIPIRRETVWQKRQRSLKSTPGRVRPRTKNPTTRAATYRPRSGRGPRAGVTATRARPQTHRWWAAIRDGYGAAPRSPGSLRGVARPRARFGRPFYGGPVPPAREGCGRHPCPASHGRSQGRCRKACRGLLSA